MLSDHICLEALNCVTVTIYIIVLRHVIVGFRKMDATVTMMAVPTLIT